MKKSNPMNISSKELEKWLKQEGELPVLVDVREDQELVLAPFPYEVIHLPLSQISCWGENISDLIACESRIVVLCHSGIRSLNFANWLLEQRFDYQIWNLEGGIDSWSLEIDPSVPRY